MTETRQDQQAKALAAVSPLNTLCGDSPYEIYIFDARTFALHTANAVACKNLGYSSEELSCLKAPDIMAITAEDLEKVVRTLEDREANCRRDETFHRRKDGSQYPVQTAFYISSCQDKTLLLCLSIPQRRRTDMICGRHSTTCGQDVLQTIPCAIFTVDTNKRITSWGSHMEKMTGLKTERVMGKHCHDIWKCSACEKGCSLFNPSVAKPIYNRQCQIKIGDRNIVISKNADMLQSPNGHVIGGIEVCQDITQAKTLMDELARSYSFQRTLNDLLSISLENMPLEEIAGKFLEKITNISCLPLEPKGAVFLVEDKPDVLLLKAHYNFDPSLLETCRKIRFGQCLCGRAAQTSLAICKSSDDNDHEHKSPDTHRHSHICLPIAASNKKTTGVINLYIRTDAQLDEKQVDFLYSTADIMAIIIERKHAEQSILLANEKLKESDKLKSDFIITVSHELRTPLTIFKNIISNAMAGLYGKISRKLQEHLVIADETIDRLARVITDVVDISNIDSGKKITKIEQLDINELVKSTVMSLSPAAQAKGQRLLCQTTQDLLYVRAQKEDIKKILAHLVENAIKFAPEASGCIQVRVKDLIDEIEIDVEDNGRGIPPNDIEKIFNRFVQVTKQIGPGFHGIGLGLAICKELVEIHGGRIWVESKPDKGANFCFVLPKYQQAPKSETPKSQPLAGQSTPFARNNL